MTIKAKFRHIIASIVCLVGALTATAQINTTQMLNIGRNALYFEDYVLAIQYFNQVIAAKPYLAEPYFYRSVAKLSLDDYQGAETDAALCIERNPFIVDAYQVMGVAKQNQGKFAEALQYYDDGLKQLPEDKTFLMNKAVCQLEMKQLDEADTTFNTLLRFDSRNDRAFLGLARLNLQRGDTAQALNNVEKCLELNHNVALAYVMKAEISMRFNHDYEDALKNMDEAIKLQPQEPGYFINRAYMKYNLDDYDGAMADYDYAVTLDPTSNEAHFNRGMLFAEVGQDNRAIDDISFIISNDPSNTLALYQRAYLYTKINKYKLAIQDFNEVINRYPDFEEAYMARANAKQEMGDFKGSERDMQQVMAIFKKKKTKVSTYNPVIEESEKAREKAIAQANGEIPQEQETEDDIRRKFNTLLTVKTDDDAFKPEYENKARGHIQHTNVDIEPQPMIVLSYYAPLNELNGATYYIKEITALNETKLLPKNLQLKCGSNNLNESQAKERFASVEYYNGLLSNGNARAIDYLARAIDHLLIKDPDHAIEDAQQAINMLPQFTVAHFLIANAHFLKYQLAEANNGTDITDPNAQAAAAQLKKRELDNLLQLAEQDYKKVTELSPDNVYAFYNLGNVFLHESRYTEAINAFNQAIKLKPDLGEAYFNRGLMYLKLGNKANGIADLSKAGELGILPSYNVLKRINR